MVENYHLQSLAGFDQRSCRSDGMIATPDGKSVIISFYNPNPAPHGETRQYSLETGSLEVTWITPGAPRNTCPQLVSMQGKIYLVITTAVEFMSAEEQSSSPESGSLFFAPTDFDTPSDSRCSPTAICFSLVRIEGQLKIEREQ